jgi:hypothetical protein
VAALLDLGRVASQEVLVTPVPGKSDFRFDDFNVLVAGVVDVVDVVVGVGSGMDWSTFTLRCLWCLPR